MCANKDTAGLGFADDLVTGARDVFTMLADVTRIKIILALGDHGELAVGDLASIVQRNSPAVSQHLAKMRMAKMVTSRQDGTSVFYRLTDEHALALVRESIRQAEHALTPPGQLPSHH